MQRFQPSKAHKRGEPPEHPLEVPLASIVELAQSVDAYHQSQLGVKELAVELPVGRQE